MARKRFKSFSRATIEGHLKASHGRCPPELTAHFSDLLAAREWTFPVTIGEAFGLVSHAHVRHAMTDYDRLLRIPGLTREEALLITRPEVLAIVSSWATLPSEAEAPNRPGAGVLETGDAIAGSS